MAVHLESHRRTDVLEHANADRSEVIVLGYDPARMVGGVISVTKVLLEELSDARLHPLKFGDGWKSLWPYLMSLARFVRVLVRRHKAIITHAIVGSRGDRLRIMPALVLCKLFRVPICIQYHKNTGNLAFGTVRDYLINQIYRLANLHVFLSSSLLGEFRRFAPKIPWLRCTVINNALPESWMGLPIPPLEQRDIDVVFFGRWNPEKGIDVLTQYLRTTRRCIRCEIYTDDVRELGIKGTVVKRWAQEDKVRAVMGRARLLMLPSYHEAYPAVIMEALACGTPFVASGVGGIPDIAIESHGGLLVPAGDVQALETAIGALLDDKSAWEECSTLGWNWVNETCKADRVVSKWQDVYTLLRRRLELVDY